VPVGATAVTDGGDSPTAGTEANTEGSAN
jgi:hypothetical protein